MLRYLLDTNIVIYVIKKSNAPERSLSVVEDFCTRLDVLPYGPKAAQHCGSIRSALEKRGQTIGVNNRREFERVEALQLDNWAI